MTSIYTIGDSFTAGAELIDHTFVSYQKLNPKNLNEYLYWCDSKEFKNEMKAFGNNYNKMYGEKTRAWPAKLGKLCNAEVVNAAFGGSNPMMWRGVVLKDFIEFQKYDRKIDIGIVQITEFSRVSLCQLDEDQTIIYNNMGPYTLEYGNEYEKQYYKARMMLQDEFGFFFTFLLELAAIKCIMLSFGVKTVKFVMSIYPDLAKINRLTEINDIKRLIDFLELDFKNITSMQPEDEKSFRLPGGHFKEEVHELFAHKIKNLLNL